MGKPTGTPPTNEVVTTARQMLTLLNGVGVLQPVADDDIERVLRATREAVVSLERLGLVRRLPNDKWVLTARGLGFAGTREMGRRRDVLRLLHLIDVSKEAAGETSGLGDASSPVVQDSP